MRSAASAWFLSMARYVQRSRVMTCRRQRDGTLVAVTGHRPNRSFFACISRKHEVRIDDDVLAFYKIVREQPDRAEHEYRRHVGAVGLAGPVVAGSRARGGGQRELLPVNGIDPVKLHLDVALLA